MDFELNEEQRAIQETARRVVQKELPRPLVLQRVKNGVEPPRELFWKLGAMGMYRFLMPPAFGGQETIDPIGMLTGVEQLARASSSLTTVYGRAGVILGPLIANFGTPAQQKLILSKVAAGDAFMSMALTESESEAASDGASLRTRAVRQSDGSWLINGSKLCCTLARGVDFLILCARTAPDAIKQRGIAHAQDHRRRAVHALRLHRPAPAGRLRLLRGVGDADAPDRRPGLRDRRRRDGSPARHPGPRARPPAALDAAAAYALSSRQRKP
jgi:alkylation response protein AidB-like acyl-CoA dehydrogenase